MEYPVRLPWLVGRFREKLQSLVGTTCQRALGGYTGGWITLHMGELVPSHGRDRSLRDGELEGEHVLRVTCSWRIEGPIGIITSAWSGDIDPETGFYSSMIEGLDLLVGARIEHIHLDLPSFDLVLTFSGGLRLRIFCDQTHDPLQDNYAIANGTTRWIVGERSHLRMELA